MAGRMPALQFRWSIQGVKHRNQTIEHGIIWGECRAPIRGRLGYKAEGMIRGGQDARPTIALEHSRG